jgi:taurine dioxygenase
MGKINSRPISDEIPFGSRVTGVTLAALDDADVRRELFGIFKTRGVLLFEGLDMSDELHLKIAQVFGPLQNYALPVSQKELTVEEDKASKAQLLDLEIDSLSEVDGEQVTGVLPWHFDSAYVGNINRGGVLRPVVIPPQGGETGFADGIQLYNDIPHELRSAFEDLQIVYYSKLMFTHQRFGFPKGLRYLRLGEVQEESIRKCEGARRAIHPAIWQRTTGERVLHISPFQAAGIHLRENPEGDALLEEMCQEIYARMIPYWHKWKMDEIVVWDNWRCLHCVRGYPPGHRRHVQRYTVEGDYGFGFWEPEDQEQQPVPA